RFGHLCGTCESRRSCIGLEKIFWTPSSFALAFRRCLPALRRCPSAQDQCCSSLYLCFACANVRN
ncbi:hypothetical protein HAX54_001209, partial [Datura stramonium]|nr:hypothetical protein [Datura stramonium]